MPKISVVMPTYIHERFLNEAVDSVLAQTYTDFELLIIDDSPDGTAQKTLESYDDSRIKYIRGNSRGLPAALNQGILAAAGEYVARMDSDDISAADRFEKQVRYLDSHPAVALCGGIAHCFDTDTGKLFPAYYSRGGKKEYADPGLLDILRFNVASHPTIMFRRELFIQNDLLYNEYFTTSEDQELYARVLKRFKIHNLNDVILHHRMHAQNAAEVRLAESNANLLQVKMDIMKSLFPCGAYDVIDFDEQMNVMIDILERGPFWKNRHKAYSAYKAYEGYSTGGGNKKPLFAKVKLRIKYRVKRACQRVFRLSHREVMGKLGMIEQTVSQKLDSIESKLSGYVGKSEDQ